MRPTINLRGNLDGSGQLGNPGLWNGSKNTQKPPISGSCDGSGNGSGRLGMVQIPIIRGLALNLPRLGYSECRITIEI
jgi:hypothetical protein